MQYRLGKLPARPGAVKLRMASFIDPAALPTPPKEFGHEQLVPRWGMLANNLWGDCVIAGGLHETRLWNRQRGVTVPVGDACAIRNYSAITHFDPNAGPPGRNRTDRGTDMEYAARYRRHTGLVDAAGKHHRIGAYVALDPGDLEQLWAALYLFDAVGVGVEYPAQWSDAFARRKPWDAVAKPRLRGGHYVSGVARRGGNLMVVSWGRLHPMTPAGYTQFCDEAIAYLSLEKLTRGKDSDGFSLTELRSALAKVTTL